MKPLLQRLQQRLLRDPDQNRTHQNVGTNVPFTQTPQWFHPASQTWGLPIDHAGSAGFGGAHAGGAVTVGPGGGVILAVAMPAPTPAAPANSAPATAVVTAVFFILIAILQSDDCGVSTPRIARTVIGYRMHPIAKPCAALHDRPR
jgi:hypothetical protein